MYHYLTINNKLSKAS